MELSVLEPTVIYEDRDVIVLDKPAGLQVHHARISGKSKRLQAPGGAHDNFTLTDWLVAHYPEVRKIGDDPSLRPGIVHRLDKDTSGVMVVARTAEAFKYLKELFQNHAMGKMYLALVHGVPKEKTGVVDAPIGIRTGTLKRSVKAIRGTKMMKDAVTEYRVKKTFARVNGEYALLEVRPKTGRTHQIRVHLASIGHPIVGDKLYGKKMEGKEGEGPRLMLHASTLEFTTPDGKRMKFEAELSTPDFNGI